MIKRHSRIAPIALLAVLLAACGDSQMTETGGTGTDRSDGAPVADASVPAGESVAELRAAAEQEIQAGRAEDAGEAAAFRFPRKNIVELAQATPSLSILVQAVVKADLVDVLSAPGNFTVFAPTNDAFVALLAELGLGSLHEVPVETLRTVLLSHVFPDYQVPGFLFRPIDFLDLRLQSAGPLKFELERAVDARSFTVNGISVVDANNRASNGIVHVIDRVLPVPDARPTITDAAVALAAQGQFTALVAAVVKTDLAGTLADETAQFTVFAPTDEAFARLGFTAASINALSDPAAISALRDVLLDHVVKGEFSRSEIPPFRFLSALGGLLLRVDRSVTTVNDIPLVAADAVKARNGVVHVIDGVLLPRH